MIAVVLNIKVQKIKGKIIVLAEQAHILSFFRHFQIDVPTINLRRRLDFFFFIAFRIKCGKRGLYYR